MARAYICVESALGLQALLACLLYILGRVGLSHFKVTL